MRVLRRFDLRMGAFLFRILCLSGGGYKGLYTAQFLAGLEAENNDIPLHRRFDLLAGTSIGGILALAISSGQATMGEIVEAMSSGGTEIFGIKVAGWRILFVCTLGFGIWWLWPINETAVMRDFMHGGNRMESQLTIPLERAGSEILPSVLEAIQDKEMPRRRYAIGFIGREAYEPALPVLRSILEDETEIWYFRADALEAIYLINPKLAIELSPSFLNEPEWLGRYARNIRDGNPLLTLD